MANTELKNLDTAKNINSKEQQKARNDILMSVNKAVPTIKDPQKQILIKKAAPLFLQDLQSL